MKKKTLVRRSFARTPRPRTKPPTPLVAWHRGEKTTCTLTRYDVLTCPDITLEHCHDWIQWAFPLAVPSVRVAGSSVLTAIDLEEFDEVIPQTSVRKLLWRLYAFIGMTRPGASR